jgi:hypothetical protein
MSTFGNNSTHVSAVKPYVDITAEVTNKIQLPAVIQQTVAKKSLFVEN